MDNDLKNINKTPPPIKRKVIFDSKENIIFSPTDQWKKFSKSEKKSKVPIFPSPIDRIRVGTNRRAKALGLSKCLDISFDHNQSFPNIKTKKFRRYEIDLDTPAIKKKIKKMDKIRVDGSNGLRFSLRRVKGCFTPGTGSPFGAASTSLILSSGSESLSRVPKSGINPNKAVFTIDSKTSQILIVNNNACQLLGYSPKELCSMEFSDLLINKNKSYVCALAEGELNSEDGTIVLLSGKVVEMNTKTNDKVAVSLWIRQIDSDGRCLAVAEPVERRVCQFVIDRNGIIVNADHECLMLFQFESSEHLIGMEISTLIPAIILPDTDYGTDIPKNVKKQKATGKTADGISFPLCLLVNHNNDKATTSGNDNINATTSSSSAMVSTTTITTTTTSTSTSTAMASSSSNLYNITVWVFQNLSGLLVIDEYGFIESCNHHFSMLMFGYAQNKILNNHISKLIPNFGQELEYLGMSRSRNVTESSLDNESETETDPVYVVNNQQQINPVTTALSLSSSAITTIINTISTTVTTTANYTKNCQGVNNLSSSSASSSLLLSSSSSSQNNENIFPLSSNKLQTIDSKLNDKRDIFPSSSSSIENFENDKNIPNIKSVNELRNSMIINETCNVELNQSNNDNDLLTPVNDDSINNQSYCITSLSQQNSTANITNSMNTTDTSLNLNNVTNPLDFSTSMISSVSSSLRSNTEKNKMKTLTTTTTLNTIAATTTTTVTNTTTTLPSNTVTTTISSSLLVTSTPYVTKTSQTNIITKKLQCSDGKYKGEAIHSDGNVIDILYTVSKQILPCGREIYCVWICRDPDTVYDECDDDDEHEGRHQNLTLTFNSVTSTVEHSLGQAIKYTAAQNSSSRPNSVSLMSQCEDEQISGEFSKHYTTLKQIGKGAYGYVKMAYRNNDRLLVVAKFILKEKLCPQFMILTDDKKEIPMEIYLLTTVKHPNIVTVYDVFENEKFFQLVMEKHGSGMDLFEFIDRRPLIDEKLGCYIFRQIANAVNYLHSLNILHRDIKDENIIIDHNFHVKLIDFGSATFMEEGKLFSTFFGTTEYCSPEVLAGNKYAGPELEMWSLGVTLYVLMFFENPFLDVEETLRADLIMPHKVSTNLENLLLSMLDKDPKTRCTMRQLMSDPWINQDINPSLFNFAWIVPCEPHESNPEKYYTGQVYSSTTALSTTSPQDSLSLVDEDSMIDGEEVDDDDDDDDEEKLSLQFQQARICDNNDKSLSVQNTEGITSQMKQTNLKSDIGLNTSSVSLASDQHQKHQQRQQQQPNQQTLSMDSSKEETVETENLITTMITRTTTTTTTKTTTTTTKPATTMRSTKKITIKTKKIKKLIKKKIIKHSNLNKSNKIKNNDDDININDKSDNDNDDDNINDDKKTNASYEIISIENNEDDSADAVCYDDDCWEDDIDDDDDDDENYDYDIDYNCMEDSFS